MQPCIDTKGVVLVERLSGRHCSRPGTGSFYRESQKRVRSAMSLTMERFREKVPVPLLQAVNGY